MLNTTFQLFVYQTKKCWLSDQRYKAKDDRGFEALDRYHGISGNPSREKKGVLNVPDKIININSHNEKDLPNKAVKVAATYLLDELDLDLPSVLLESSAFLENPLWRVLNFLEFFCFCVINY